jgi:hypothetical protein
MRRKVTLYQMGQELFREEIIEKLLNFEEIG